MALIRPAAGLDGLAATVTGLTGGIGEASRKRFFGHLTLARVKPNVVMPRALGTLVSAEFDVDEIALVQSRRDPAGARYDTIETWPLG